MTTIYPETIEDKLGTLFTKIPPLPSYFISQLTQLAPIIVVILGIFEIFNSGVIELIQQSRLTFLLQNKIFDATYYLLIVLHLIIGVILILAYKPLQRKKTTGWRMLFYTNIMYIAVSLVMGDLGGIVLNAVVFYILFQVRNRYF